jgi:hypothetical protein
MFRSFQDVVSFQTGDGRAWNMTNKGIEISLPSLKTAQGLLLLLNCRHSNDHSGRLAIFTNHIPITGQRVRIDFNVFTIDLVRYMHLEFKYMAFYLLKAGKQLWSKASPVHENRMCCRFMPGRNFEIVSVEPIECWEPMEWTMRLPASNKVGVIKIAHNTSYPSTPPQLTLRLRAAADSFQAHIEVLVSDGDVPIHLPKPDSSGLAEACVWVKPWTVSVQIRRREVAGQLIIGITVMEPLMMTEEEAMLTGIQIYTRQRPIPSRRSARLRGAMDTTT